MAYASGARKHGANIRLGTSVEGLILRSDGRWDVSTNKGTVVAKRVINASGMDKQTAKVMMLLDLSRYSHSVAEL